MKQLFIFNESSQAAKYGIGTYIQALVVLLNEYYRITVVVLDSEKQEYTLIKEKQYHEIHIPKCPIAFCTIEERNKYMKNVFYLLCSSINPDEEIFFHFNYTTESSLYELSKSHFPQSKTILTVHYLYWCFLINGNISLFREIINRNSEQPFNKVEKDVLTIYQKEITHFNHSDYIITLSEFTKNLLISDYKIPENKISIHSNGLEDVNYDRWNTYKAKIKESLRFSQDSYIVLFVGRLNTIKGLDYLIKSFDLVLNKIPSVQLLIIGDGDYNEFFKDCKGFGDRVIFLGHLNRDELYKYYQIADVGVLPSFHEQCSYVAIEMMMHGIPVISSTSTGLHEMMEDNISCLHIPVIENVDSVEIDIALLADKITYLLQNQKVAKRLGINARKRYLKNYSLPVFRKNIFDFYQSL